MVGAATILAQAAEEGGNGLGGWYVGVAIGFVVVVVVVVIVSLILDIASKISRQARMAQAALDDAQVTTLPLWDVAVTNLTALAVLEGAQRARKAVEAL